MAINSILPPYPLFFDLAGKPLEDGYVYIGLPGYEARSTPKASYFDMALSVPTGTAVGAAVRTSGGYPTFNGAARMIYVDGDYSITVTDRNGVLLYTSLNRSIAYAIDAATVTALGLDDRLLYRGATEPSPTAPGALWFDTGTSILKRRNAANTGWINVNYEGKDADQDRGFTFSTIQTLSGASALDFTEIPAWATEIIIPFNGMTWSAGDNTVVQVGTTDTTTVVSGYESTSLTGVTGSTTLVTSTTGFVVAAGPATDAHTGVMRLYKYAPTVWIGDHNVDRHGVAASTGAGRVTITGTLNKIRVTRSGAAVGDGGSVNVGWR